jgi:hypothetical protein
MEWALRGQLENMGTPFRTRVLLKIKRTVRELDPVEREFSRVWPTINSVEGLLVEGQEKWLFKTARSLPDPANLVEIGSFKGRSTCCLALGCRGTGKRVYAIDPFDRNEWDSQQQIYLEEFRQNIERCGISNYVEPTIGLSNEVAKSWTKPIHFLFIDGSHRYEDVMADFEDFLPHVVPGGIVAFHDVCEGWPGVFKAWHEIFKHRLTDIGYCTTIGYGRKRKE